MVAVDEIREAIQKDLDPLHVEVVDQTGTGDHFQAIVVSKAFEGRSRVQQHQAVYRALGDRMKQAIHALALRTLTPEQWEEQRAGGRS